MKWTAQAPANIALIKYMGKSDDTVNLPTNASLSLTLPHLLSHVEVSLAEGSEDQWRPLALAGFESFKLTEKGVAKFLKHVTFLKEKFGYQGAFLVKSVNAFPSDCGLASSASSFAALTLAMAKALSELTGKPLPSMHEMAVLSRQGSGSSCRSFFAPWAMWEVDAAASGQDRVTAVELPFNDLFHQVVVVNDRSKAVSSSEAHRRVTSSALFKGRIERANDRLRELLAALRAENWKQAFDLTWTEFWDMHALFETSQPPFGYMAAGSLEVLNEVRDYWTKNGDGPLVTMDAGPNVHLLYRHDQRIMIDHFRGHFDTRYRVICSLDWNRKRSRV